MTIGGLSGSGSLCCSEHHPVHWRRWIFKMGAPVASTVGKNNSSTTYSGVMSGAGSLIKVGRHAHALRREHLHRQHHGQRWYAGTRSTDARHGLDGFVSSGAALRLNFATTNRVTALVLNGVNKPVGVYNSTTGAPFITGTGSLLVQPMATNPTNITVSVSGNTLTFRPADHLGWILQQQSNSPPSVSAPTGQMLPVARTSPAPTSPSIRRTRTVFYRLSKP